MKANDALPTERKRLVSGHFEMGLSHGGLLHKTRYQIAASNKNSPSIRIASPGDRNRCPVRERLLQDYNRRFKGWAAHADEGKMLSGDSESERLALARLEGAHQKLVQHQRSCGVCKRAD